MEHLTNKRAMQKQFISIFIPTFFSQLSFVAGGFFATVMAGQHSTVDLAGVAVGSNIWIPILITAIGFFLGNTPIVSQLLGANKLSDIPSIIRQAVYFAIAIGILVLIFLEISLPPLLNYLSLDMSVKKIAQDFLTFIKWGVIPTFISITLRSIVDAHGKTKESLCVVTIGFIVNILLNYCFIYGFWVFPELGGVGTGIGIAASNLLNCLLFIAIITLHPTFKPYQVLHQIEPISFCRWKNQLSIGLPIGAANFLEISLFSIIGLLITEYGTNVIAAHQAAINFGELMYTFPLSAGIAATILCGFSLGGHKYKIAFYYARFAQIFTTLIASIIFVLSIFSIDSIAGMYSSAPEMIRLIGSFIPYTLCYLFADALGVPILGALRGYKDVHFIFKTSLLSYWIIGLSFGVILSQLFNLGPYGYWIGITTGLFVAAILYNIRIIQINKNKKK